MFGNTNTNGGRILYLENSHRRCGEIFIIVVIILVIVVIAIIFIYIHQFVINIVITAILIFTFKYLSQTQPTVLGGEFFGHSQKVLYCQIILIEFQISTLNR